MSKYDALWKWIGERDSDRLGLSFSEIEEISGVSIDHSFLKYKKELGSYGYAVEKISMKNKTVSFVRRDGG